MNQRLKTIFEDAQKLGHAEREELVELLLATIDNAPGLDQAWADEAHHRWEQHVATGEVAVDALAAVEDARALLGRSRTR